MSIDFNSPAPTSITIRPEPQAAEAFRGWRKPIQKATLGDDDFSKQLGNTQPDSRTSSSAKGGQSDVSFWGADGFGLDDVIDLINPLQHIPIVSTIYRAITGDEIAAGPKLIGGGVIGGVVGLAASAADVIFEQETGKNIGGNVMAMINGDEAAPAAVEKKQAAKQMPELQTQASAARTVPDRAVADASHTAAAPLTAAPLTEEQFTQIQTAAQMSSVDANVIASGDKQKSQTLLDLFGGTRAKAQQDYAKAQSLMYSQKAARDLKM